MSLLHIKLVDRFYSIFLVLFFRRFVFVSDKKYYGLSYITLHVYVLLFYTFESNIYLNYLFITPFYSSHR